MFADPTTHTQADYQGWAPAVEWSDFGRLDGRLARVEAREDPQRGP